MTRDAIVDLVTRWQATFNARDRLENASLYDGAATVESPLVGSRSGRDGVLSAIDALHAAFPGMVITPEPPVVDEHHGRAAIVASVSGIHTGQLMGLEATGKPFRFTIVFLLEMRGGRIVRDRRIYDFTGLLVQIGVLKAKPA